MEFKPRCGDRGRSALPDPGAWWSGPREPPRPEADKGGVPRGASQIQDQA
jgi:hypothetical protein